MSCSPALTRRSIPVYATEALGKMAAKATPREVRHLSDMVEHYRREFRRIASENVRDHLLQVAKGIADAGASAVSGRGPRKSS